MAGRYSFSFVLSYGIYSNSAVGGGLPASFFISAILGLSVNVPCRRPPPTADEDNGQCPGHVIALEA